MTELTLNFLATAVTADLIKVGPASGTGINSGIHVAPGATTTLTANFAQAASGRSWSESSGQANAQGRLFSGGLGTTGPTGTGTVTLTAPSTPGIYFVGVRDALQLGCDNNALGGGSHGANIASLTRFLTWGSRT